MNEHERGGEASGTRSLHVFVEGRVQGVFFRQSTLEQARAAGVEGWVRNLPDGRVEARLSGPSPAVASVLDWMRAGGPPAGRVDALDERPDDSPCPPGFQILPTPS